ncbi:MAG: hypothetical protein OXI77_02720 [Chloroflexota bacterium]|nr:hypothetical protein [Chloroflexota bacterium]MDE2909994.1 hypothetical protein [Chloroflexota bacterium]
MTTEDAEFIEFTEKNLKTRRNPKVIIVEFCRGEPVARPRFA